MLCHIQKVSNFKPEYQKSWMLCQAEILFEWLLMENKIISHTYKFITYSDIFYCIIYSNILKDYLRAQCHVVRKNGSFGLNFLKFFPFMTKKGIKFNFSVYLHQLTIFVYSSVEYCILTFLNYRWCFALKPRERGQWTVYYNNPQSF